MTCNFITLSVFDSISNCVFSLTTIGLAFYVFVYQKNKDKKDRDIQLFKDLIITPKINILETYFDEVNQLKNQIKSNELSEDDRMIILTNLKDKSSTFRKEFLISIQSIAPNLHKEIELKIDSLTDHITNTLGNDELKLCHPKTYEREIGLKIRDTYMDVLRYIFHYSGEQTK